MEENNPFDLRKQFTPPVTKLPDTDKAYWFIFHQEKLLVNVADDKTVSICNTSPSLLGITLNYTRFLGHYDQKPCFVAEVETSPAFSKNLRFLGLRFVADKIGKLFFNLAGRALQILHHHKENLFCSRCGSPMEDRDTDLAKSCPACNFVCFPRVSPAVIMAITKNNQILLGRAERFPAGMYSTLAGFVEPGETLEETVKREVFEETGITVGKVRYVASQPWPFPHSIMVGFTAEYIEGEIVIDSKELEDAKWFSAQNMPLIPDQTTIARLLINDFLEKWS